MLHVLRLVGDFQALRLEGVLKSTLTSETRWRETSLARLCTHTIEITIVDDVLGLCVYGTVLQGSRGRFLLGGCSLLVGLLILSLMEVRRLVLFGLSRVFRIVWVVVLVLLACMMMLELTGLAGLAGVAYEPDQGF